MESRLWNSPPSCGHGVQTKIQGLVGTPLCTPPWGSRGVVLLSSKVWKGSYGGEDLAIGIACFTTPPPLSGDQTHTHTRAWGACSAWDLHYLHDGCRSYCCLSKSETRNESAKEILSNSDCFFLMNCLCLTKRTGHCAWPHCSFS
jgi:hypothetical protein